MYALRKTQSIIENVTYKNPTIDSRASYELLRRKLFHSRVIPFIHKGRLWLKFRNRFVREKQRTEGLICHYCKSELCWNDFGKPKNKRVTIDHVIPLSKGGDKWNKKNLVIACETCNREKGNK